MTTPAVRLPERLRREIVAHCVGRLPNEGCGLLGMAGGEVVRIYPTANADASPTSFTVPPTEHMDALVDAEADGLVLGGVFHSHPEGPATMSTIDIERALDTSWVYVVVGLENGEPEFGAFMSDGSEIEIIE